MNNDVRYRWSTTPGYTYDVWAPVVSWTADEWILTRSGALRLGSGCSYGWRPVHELNDREHFSAAVAAMGGTATPRGGLRT